MPRFRFTAMTADGDPFSGEMEAPSREAVVARLQASGHLPLQLHGETAAGMRARPLFGRRRAVSEADVAFATRKLATLLRAGVALDGALGMLVTLTPHGSLRRALEQVRARVQGGAPLSDALEHEGCFGRFYVSTLRAGEASGALDIVLERLAEHLERARRLRANIHSALLYPSILVLVAGLSLILLMAYVVPQFQPLFDGMDRALPVSTRVVFAVAAWLQGYWWLLLGLAGGAGLWLRRQLAEPGFRRHWDGLVLRLPLVADLAIKSEVARFSRGLATLLQNGVALVSALAIVREAFTNAVLRDAMGPVAENLSQGRGLAQPLAETGRFPDLAVHLIRVGEESGRLPEMLGRVAEIYDEELREAVRRLLSVLEPVLILGLGVLIAGIIMSVLVAILSLNEFAM